MKRWFLGLLFLLGGMIGLAQADYIIIIANLGVVRDAENPEGEAAPPEGEKGAKGGGLKPGGIGIGAGSKTPAEQPKEGESHLLVTAVIEVSRAAEVQIDQDKKVWQVTHRLLGGEKWYNTVFQPTDNIKIIKWTMPDGKPMPTLAERYHAKYQKIVDNKRPIEEVLDVAEWALGHGLTSQCAKVMTQHAAKVDPNHEAVVAFQKTLKNLEQPITKDDTADLWKTKLLSTYRIVRSHHYALLHNAQNDKDPDVVSHLARLEDAHRSFYYWFALKRKVLPVPDTRLVAILATKDDDFWRQYRIFNSPTRVADGFYAPRENIVVFSGTSLDAAHNAMLTATKELWTTFDRDQLLMGQLPKFPIKTEEDYKKAEEMRKLSPEAATKALFLKALELDSERATVSHDATRQLVAAAGLLPRNVATPEWAQFGMGSFFEAAKGSPWGGVGVPSHTFNDQFNYLFQYKKMINADRKLDKTALLEGVVTDRFFREAKAKNDGTILLKARTTAWALTFFLAHKKLDDLEKYYKELAKLPRDLEFDDEVLLNCFARACNLMDRKQPNRVDRALLNRFAVEWYDFINLTPLEADEMLKQVQKNQAELKKPNPVP